MTPLWPVHRRQREGRSPCAIKTSFQKKYIQREGGRGERCDHLGAHRGNGGSGGGHLPCGGGGCIGDISPTSECGGRQLKFTSSRHSLNRWTKSCAYFVEGCKFHPTKGLHFQPSTSSLLSDALPSHLKLRCHRKGSSLMRPAVKLQLRWDGRIQATFPQPPTSIDSVHRTQIQSLLDTSPGLLA